MAVPIRDGRGRWTKKANTINYAKPERIIVEHNYATDSFLRSGDSTRRITSQNHNKPKGLGGYLNVQCQIVDCAFVNCVPYGKTHRIKSRKSGMPCFAVNSVGGPTKVNNILSTLIIPALDNNKLKKWNVGREKLLSQWRQNQQNKLLKMLSIWKYSKYEMDDIDIAEEETKKATESIDFVLKDLGLAVLPGASPSVKMLLKTDIQDNDWSDVEKSHQVNMSHQVYMSHQVNRRNHQIIMLKLGTLQALIACGVCTLATAENIACSGLNLNSLKKIFLRQGEDGLPNTFTWKNSEGQPRDINDTDT
ncbi:hypothetical protein MAR_009460 [Mya arenaria]|uniref:PML C-terminal domain-containing protein n=1 Tax=Mya arenaria TaxID=6604 RepID=A0ABY7DYU2_MYAAR|nr:hypothetical protein MAR_009460 [Mya arenaria]